MLSDYGSVACLVERATREAQAEQHLDVMVNLQTLAGDPSSDQESPDPGGQESNVSPLFRTQESYVLLKCHSAKNYDVTQVIV